MTVLAPVPGAMPGAGPGSPDFDPEDFRALAEAKRHFFAFFLKRRATTRPRELAFMASGERLEVSHADAALEVRAWGAGPTVLLAHGALGSGGSFHALVPALVARGLRAVAFDAPAHGASAGLFAYADEVADALLSLRAALGPLAALVGHSMGASWALHASRAGLRVPRLVCVSMPARASLAIDLYVQQSYLEPAVEAHLRRLISAFAPSPTVAMAVVGRLEAEALVVHDREDSLAPFEDAEQLATRWPAARALWTSGLGHFHVLQDPRVVTAIADFAAGAPFTEEVSRCLP